MTEHTPGPWHSGTFERKWSIFGPEGCGRMHAENAGSTLCPIARIMRDEHIPEGVDRANARLLAAAPDLLAACEGMPVTSDRFSEAELQAWCSDPAALSTNNVARLVCHMTDTWHATGRAQAAIAKARGATREGE